MRGDAAENYHTDLAFDGVADADVGMAKGGSVQLPERGAV